MDEQIDWLQTNLLCLPENAGQDDFTPDDRRRLLLCLLDPEELEGEHLPDCLGTSASKLSSTAR